MLSKHKRKSQPQSQSHSVWLWRENRNGWTQEVLGTQRNNIKCSKSGGPRNDFESSSCLKMRTEMKSLRKDNCWTCWCWLLGAKQLRGRNFATWKIYSKHWESHWAKSQTEESSRWKWENQQHYKIIFRYRWKKRNLVVVLARNCFY